MKLLARFSTFALLALAACDPAVTSAPANEFSAVGASGEVRLSNQTDQAVHYVMFAEGAIVDLNPEWTEWPALQPGAEARVPYAQIRGEGSRARAAILYWQSSERVGGGPLRVPFR